MLYDLMGGVDDNTMAAIEMININLAEHPFR